MVTGPERLRQTLDSTRADERAALLVCLPTIDNVSWSLAAARTCVAAGADLLEFQTRYPFHPEPTVAAITEVAAGVEVPCLLWADFDTVRAFALNAVGRWQLVPACVAAGIAGVIAPIPLGSGEAFADACGDDVSPIAFVSPDMQAEHFDEACRTTGAFAYAIGTPTDPPNDPSVFEEYAAFVERVRATSGAPVVVGAGVTTPAQAALAATFADGVATAKAVFATLRDAATRRESQLDALEALVGMLRRAVERDRDAQAHQTA